MNKNFIHFFSLYFFKMISVLCKNYIIKENIKPKLFNKRSITFLTSRIILVCRNRSFQTEPRCGKRCRIFKLSRKYGAIY